MKIEILFDTVCGGQRVKADEKIEASEKDALLLMKMGKASPADEEANKLMKKSGVENLVEGGLEAAENKKAEKARASKTKDKEAA